MPEADPGSANELILLKETTQKRWYWANTAPGLQITTIATVSMSCLYVCSALSCLFPM